MRKNRIKDVLINLLLTVLAAAIGGLPFWSYLFMRSMLTPQGFWQNFFLLGFGLYVLGAAQIVFLILFFVALYVIWGD